jgi:PAS domain S-box-containing protein/putative nucleotidyltransferase with HDIG domain
MPSTADEYFRTAFASAGHGVAVCELNGRFAAVNDVLCTLVARTPDELSRLRFHDITHPDDLPVSVERVERLLSGDISHYELEKRYRHRNGEWIPIRLNVGVVDDATGKPRHLVAQIQDLSEVREALTEANVQRKHREETAVELLRAVARTVEKADRYTTAHQGRVADLARRIAEAIGLPQHTVTATRLGAMMHDIGKIHVPQQILTKPGRLSESELALVREHVDVGYDILARASLPWPVADIVRQHHERVDGGGYPRGLKRTDICIEARIVSVADVYDSIANFRPYRPARGRNAALAELVANSDTLYDGDVVRACAEVTE